MDARSAPPAQMERTKSLHPARRGRWYWCLFGVSILGALDIGQFLASNDGMFRAAPDRAAGSVLGLGLWLALVGLSGAAGAGRRSPQVSRVILVLSGLLALGSVALVAVHAAAHVGGLRPALGGILGLIAFGLAYLAHRD
jgi:hypothetical protein